MSFETSSVRARHREPRLRWPGMANEEEVPTGEPQGRATRPTNPVAAPRLGSAAEQALTRPERTRSQTRERILDAAARIFRQQGYGARLADIAEAAGMQAGSLYYHFDSRERLVEEVLHIGLRRAWDLVDEALEGLDTDATPGQRLLTAIEAHAMAILEVSDYSAANTRIFSMAADDVRERHYAFQQEYGEFFHRLIEDAVASGEVAAAVDPAVMRMLLFGAMNWTAEWFRVDRGRSAEQVVAQLRLLISQGLWVD